MNRRNLLRLIGLSPLAASMPASSAPPRLASGGLMGRLARPYVVCDEIHELVPGEVMTLRIDVGAIERAVQDRMLRFNLPVVDESFGFTDGDGI